MQLFPTNATLDDRIQIVIIFILRVITAAALGYSVAIGNIEFVINGIIALFLLFIPEHIEKRYEVKLPVEFSFAIVLFVFGAIILGEHRNYYSKLVWWDDFLHTASGVLLGFAGFLVLYSLKLREKLKASRFLISVFAFSLAVTFSVLWEVFEFSVDRIAGTDLQGGGLLDTMTDLIVASVGAVFSVALGYRFMNQPKGNGLFARQVKKFIEMNSYNKKKR